MLLKAEEVYMKFNDEDIEINIPKKLLLILLQQVSRYYDILNNEKDIINNLSVHESINNTEMIMTKLFILTAEPYSRKEVILAVSISEFLTLRDIVFCNYTLVHLKIKINSHLLKVFKEFYEHIESIYEKLDKEEVNVYWDYLKTVKLENNEVSPIR